MATLDWSQCPAVESIPAKRSGAWVFRGTRTPISTVFENLQDMNVDELVEEFGVNLRRIVQKPQSPTRKCLFCSTTAPRALLPTI